MILGFGAFTLYLYFFTNVTNVMGAIGRTNIYVYALAFVCVIFGAVFDALTWYRILGNLSVQTSFRRVFNLSWVGTFVDALIPGGWPGDIFKTYVLSKDPEVEGVKAAVSIVIKNILELMVTLGALIAGMVLLFLNYSLDLAVTIAIGVTMFLLALPLIIVIYLSTHLNAAEKMLEWANRVLAFIKRRPLHETSNVESMQKSLKEFHDGIMSMKENPKSMIEPVLLQILAWFFSILSLFIIFAALGSIVAPDKIIITNTIVANLQSQGVALSGFTQIVSSATYTILGITPIIAIASSLLAGFAVFWFKTLVAFVYFQATVFDQAVPFLCKKCTIGNLDGSMKTDFPSLTTEAGSEQQ